MSTRTLTSNFPHSVPIWQRLPWWGPVGVVALLALLAAFSQVVHAGVKRGEDLRAQAALQHQLAWRCSSMGDRQGREDCLKQLPGEAPVHLASAIR